MRDVDEDLRRGRVYLPADELAAHGVDRDSAGVVPDQPAHRRRACAGRWRSNMPPPAGSTNTPARASIADPRSRPCVAAALTLYSEILDRIEDIDYEIFSQRATVGTGRRLQVAGRGLARAWRARLTHGR